MMRLVTLALAAASFVVGAVYASTGHPSGVMGDLHRAQPERVFAARFSAETEYRPCAADPVFADSAVQRDICGDPVDAVKAGLDLEGLAAASQSLDPDSLRASALAAVIWWNERPVSLDSAIARLTDALELTRDQVPILVELSAVHLERAGRTQSVRDLLQGLEYARQALEHEPGNRLALFNAALAAQAFGLTEEAVAHWDAYLAADSTSEWADEARRRRGAALAGRMLAKPDSSATPAEVNAFARRHPQQAREHGLTVVLREWSEAVLAGEAARAGSRLALAERLGTAIKYHGGDASLADAVYAIISARGDAGATRTLARAHHAYAAGEDLFETGDYVQAADSFAVVVRLRPASPVLVGWARTSRAAALALSGRTDEAKRDLQSLIENADTIRHPAMAARIHWVQGQALPDSLRRPLFERVARTYARLGEWESYGGIRYRHAWAAHEDGDVRLAYLANGEALRALRPYRESRHLYRMLVQSAALAARDGMPRAAMLMQIEGSRVAARVPNPTDRAQAMLAHARILALADSTARARRELDVVEALIPVVPDTSQARYVEEALRYSRVLLSPGSAGYAAALDSALSHFSRVGASAWVTTIRMSRAELRLATGDLSGANEDLDSLTASIGRAPLRDQDAHLEAAVMERLRSRYDRLVMGYVRAGQPMKAFQAMERSRLSFASDTSRRAARGWVPPRPGRVVLEYALIGDTLLAWVVRRDSITLREQRLPPEELRRAIARVNVALESGASARAAAPDLRRLYDVLIRPVADRIPRAAPDETELVIVADGEIAGAPFPALMDARERYLVQDHPIRFAATLADAARVASREPVDGPALLVADPAFDRAEHAGLDQLPGAAAEVDSLAKLYGDTLLLADSTATVATFRDRAGRARVIHYAGHAVFDDGRPERSFLLLAGSGTSGRLTAEDSLDLEGVRLVVLSACRTLRGHRGRSGGFAGLSGAMLHAGAEGVVGSLWQVNDDRAQPLMMEFHREFREHGDPARALRNAQLRMIQSDSIDLRSPAVWAGFRYMGR